MKFRNEKEESIWSSAWDAVANDLHVTNPTDPERWADAKIEAMREREADPAAAIKSEAPGTIPGVKPPPQPQRSERGALERVRACVKGLGETRISKETILIYIDAELARQPELTPPNARPALERLRERVRAENRMLGMGPLDDFDKGRQAETCSLTFFIDDELSRQPADELSPKVKAVVEAARDMVRPFGIGGTSIRYPQLEAALKALDGEAK